MPAGAGAISKLKVVHDFLTILPQRDTGARRLNKKLELSSVMDTFQSIIDASKLSSLSLDCRPLILRTESPWIGLAAVVGLFSVSRLAYQIFSVALQTFVLPGASVSSPF